MASYFILGVAIAAVHQHLDKPRVTPVKYKVPHASQLSSLPLCLPASQPRLPRAVYTCSLLSHLPLLPSFGVCWLLSLSLS